MALGRMVHEIKQGQWQAFLSDPAAVNSYLGG
jgi:hypothetical protein